MRKLFLAMGLALVAMLVAAGAAFAAYTFDPATGTGFVGKGDVQLIYGYNNQQLQTNASKIDFRAITTSETSWTCSRPAPTPQDPNREITQQRNNTTTAQGLATTVARETSKGKNGPVTGFNLTGYDSPPTVIASDGPATASCPASPSGFTFDEGSQVTTTEPTQLQVTNDGGMTWYTLPPPTTTTV